MKLQEEGASPLILFVSHGPGEQEDATGIPQTGSGGKLLKALLTDRGVLERSAFTNLTRCYKPDKKPPTKRQLDACVSTFHMEVTLLNPEIICVIGATALKYLLGMSGITNVAGQVIEHQGRVYVPIMQPSAVFKSVGTQYEAQTRDAFRSQIDKLVEIAADPAVHKPRSVPHTILTDFDEAVLALETAFSRPDVSIDIETEGDDPLADDASILCLSFASVDQDTGEIQSYLIPMDHPDTPQEWLPYVIPIIEKFCELVNGYAGCIVGQNLKFEHKWFKVHWGIELLAPPRTNFDIFLAHYGAVNEWPGTHSLDRITYELAPQWGGYEIENERWAQKVGRSHYSRIPGRVLFPYCCGDTFVPLVLKPILEARITEMDNWDLHTELLFPMNWTVADMELDGTHIDVPYLFRLDRQYAKLHEVALKRLRATEPVKRTELVLNGGDPSGLKGKWIDFNPNSSPHKQHLFYKELGLPVLWVTKKTKAPSTGKLVLKKFGPKNATVRAVQLAVKVSKIRSSYITKTLNRLTDEDGNVIGELLRDGTNIAGTVTGRNSSPQQQWPKQGGIRQMVNSRFQPGVEYIDRHGRTVLCQTPGKIVSCDYDQIEIKIMAVLSGEPVLIDAIHAGQDIHRATAAYVWKVDYDAVDDMLRKRAKAVNFGILYGQGPQGMHDQNPELSVRECVEIQEEYFGRMLKVTEFCDKQREFALANGYVRSSYMNRIRRLPAAKMPWDEHQFSEAMRHAVNAPIQGDASDMNCVAANAFKRFVWERRLPWVIWLLFHDATYLDVPADDPDEPQEAATLLKAAMERVKPDWFTVPLTATYDISDKM